MQKFTKKDLPDIAGGLMDGIDLSGMDLSEMDISNTIFRHCALNNAVLKNAVLRNTRFEYCTMNMADLSGADMRGVRFRYCEIREAIFDNAVMDNVEMEFTSIESTTFIDACLKDSHIYNVDAVLAAFDRADIYSLHWSHVNLDGAKFIGAKGIFANREAVYELLRQAVSKDPEFAKLTGAVRVIKQWCWPQWRQEFQKMDTKAQKWVRDVFFQYTESGLIDALEGRRDIENV